MLLLIDNYDSFTYNLYQFLALRNQAVLVKRNDKITIDEIEQLAPQGIILSPGPGRPEQAGICVELIRAFSGRIPLLGICLGHQAIAIAFGGEVVQAEVIVHGKTSSILHESTGLFNELPQPLVVGRYHSLVVNSINLPPALQVIAKTKEGTVMAVQHQNHPTYGVQFHPESILTPEGAGLLKNFTESLSC